MCDGATGSGRICCKEENKSNSPKSSRLYANEYDYSVVIPTIRIVTDNPDQFQKAHSTDGGYDIISSRVIVIPARDRVLVPTDLRVAIPAGYVGLLKSRSGLATKHGIEHGAGVIDCGYTGEILVLMQNHSEVDYTIDSGDKIAQMLIVPICQYKVELVGSLDDSERGEAGFNSTGYK